MSDAAEAMPARWRRTQVTLIAPGLLAYEVTASLRRLVYLKALSPDEGEDAFRGFLRIPIRLLHRRYIQPTASQLAVQFNRPRTYDTAYLAVAQLNDCEFWTADETLYNAVHARLPWVKWLGNAFAA